MKWNQGLEVWHQIWFLYEHSQKPSTTTTNVSWHPKKIFKLNYKISFAKTKQLSIFFNSLKPHMEYPTIPFIKCWTLQQRHIRIKKIVLFYPGPLFHSILSLYIEFILCVVYLWLNVIDEYICGRKYYQKFKMENGVILLWFILCYDKMTIYCCFPLEIDVHMQTLNELKGQSSRRI